MRSAGSQRTTREFQLSRPAWLHSLDQAVRPQGRIFHGWWIVLSGATVQALLAALLMQSYGAYLVLLREDFGWSKAALAGAFSMSRIESGILGPLQGWLVDRYGPRSVIRVGLVLCGLGFMLLARIDSLLAFYLTFLLLALGSSLGGFVSITVALVNWFSRRRSMAVAISHSGISLGGLAVPLVIASLATYGWRATAFASGVLVIAIGLPLSQLVRHRPEQHGEHPDGLEPGLASGGSGPAIAASVDFGVREAVRTRAFWLISVGHGCALLVVSAVTVHMIPHLHESLGFSLSSAGSMIVLMTAMQFLGQLSGGYLGDRFSKRVIISLCMLGHGAGILMLAYATSPALVIAFTVIHGLAWGTRGPLMTSIRADYFGARFFGTIMGFSSLIVMLGMTAGPIFAGYVADRTGSYTPAFVAIALAQLAGSLCFLLARPPVR